MEHKLINGHEAVDLGLPSGTLWATCNVGASAPEEFGAYFAWGETTPKAIYYWDTYKYISDSDGITKYCTNSFCGMVDNRSELATCDDAATINWGSGWCMPTKVQWDELRQYCTWTWTTMSNSDGEAVYGYQVVSKFNGNSVFLPAAGYRDDFGLGYAGDKGFYWSSSLFSEHPNYAWYLTFEPDDIYWYCFYRCYGRPVRPVLKWSLADRTCSPTISEI